MSRKMKDSGSEWIGEIPEEWGVCRLKNYAQICNGQDYRDVYLENGEFPVLGSGGEFARSTEYMYDKPSVLLGRKGTVDKPLYVDFPFWTVDTMYYTVIKKSMSVKFFYYLCNIINFDYYQYGSAVPSMTQRDLNNVMFTLPTKEEQISIAYYLDCKCARVDEIIEKQKQVIEMMKAYKQSVITETVTKGLNPNALMKDSGTEWIGDVPIHWNIKKLKYEFYIKKDIAGKEGYDILSVTQRGIKIKDISNNEGQIAMDYSKYQLVDIEDYVMNHMDLLTGFVDCSKYVGVTSPDYRVFTLINKNNSKEYYKYIVSVKYNTHFFHINLMR